MWPRRKPPSIAEIKAAFAGQWVAIQGPAPRRGSPMSLHDRIEAAVRERMAVAQAAAADATADWYRYERYVEAKHPHPQIFDADEEPVLWLAMDGTQAVMDHVEANDPALILRDCERDLKVLERHQQMSGGRCDYCWGLDDSSWPCPDVRDLAEAYGITEEGDGDG